MTMKLSAKVQKRFSDSITRFKRILTNASKKDVNESDTIAIIKDMLSDILGYDKYEEVTSEYAIRGTYCDIAIKIDNEIRFLIEAKAIGKDLKEIHLNQATSYGAKEGIEWVILTNGQDWKVYKLKSKMPIAHQLVLEFNFSNLSLRNQEDAKKLFALSKEGLKKGVLPSYFAKQRALSHYTIGAILIQKAPWMS